MLKLWLVGSAKGAFKPSSANAYSQPIAMLVEILLQHNLCYQNLFINDLTTGMKQNLILLIEGFF